jgi:RNA polymerase sigma factor (sigma-70 family)
VAPGSRFPYAPLVRAGPSTLEQALTDHRGRLWGLCYRMSGCAADADDWLQDVFERALSHPPEDVERQLGPWLTHVAMNVCRDHLRRRKHAAYTGPWLPGPIETSELWARLQGEDPSPEARYGQLESVSLAFLLALEALSPTQRAVLILRDVCDLSVRETAEALALSEANVKTTHHRARAELAAHDAGPKAAPAIDARALEAFFVHLALRNVDALRALLAPDIVELHDGAGQYTAARRPIRGLEKLLLFYSKSARPLLRVLRCSLNGQPAILVEFAPRRPREPLRAAIWIETAADGRIGRVFAQVADRKLAALPWDRAWPLDLVWIARALRAAWSTPAPAAWRRAALGRALRYAAGLPSRLGERASRSVASRRHGRSSPARE